MKRWEDTIGEVERNPKSLLVLVRYENTGAKRSERIKKLFSNAKSRLKSRVIFLPHLSGGAPPPKNFDEIVKTALKNRGIQIHSQTRLEGFGFYAHICVEKGLYNLGELLGIPQEHWTINMNKSVGNPKILERHGIKWV
ncbi:MAG: hypothetical protein V1817_00470 [Candidatus Micrarchaeota archaeon]